MNKREFCYKMKQTFPELSLRECLILFDTFVETMRVVLLSGEHVNLNGMFCITPEVKKGKGVWRNPYTGVLQNLQDKIKLTISRSKAFERTLTKELLNGQSDVCQRITSKRLKRGKGKVQKPDSEK